MNLYHLSQKARNAEYNPKRFSGVVMRITNPRTTALIFSNGKIIVLGAKRVDEAKIAAKKFAKIIKKCGYQVRFSNFNVQNIVATTDIHFKLKLGKVCDMYPDLVKYEPESFPGVVYKMPEPKVTLLIFSSGKIVFTGAKDIDSINLAFRNIANMLLSCRKE